VVIDTWRLQRRWLRLQRPVAAVMVALGLGLIWVRTSAPVPSTPTVVAVSDVAAGDVIAAEDVTVVQWPNPTRPAPAASEVDALVGRRATSQIRAGEPLTPVRALGPRTVALAGPDRVAVSLPPEALTASGLIRPGDRVGLVGRTDAGPRSLADDGVVLTVDAQIGTVVAVPGSAAPAVVQAAATDSIAIVLAGDGVVG
jgi:Flp pilus assembly protein CpaB